MTRPQLGPEATRRFQLILGLLAERADAPSAVTDPDRAGQVHLADSLSGFAAEPLRSAGTIADIGSGAGFPGLVIAIARPEARVDLIEATGRKCDYLGEAVERAELANATVLNVRAEQHAIAVGREAYDVVTARAVASMAALAELASPLLRLGGALVAWKGAPDQAEREELELTLDQVAMSIAQVIPVTPFPASRRRHIYVLEKSGPTPQRLPRRAGKAQQKSLGKRNRGVR